MSAGALHDDLRLLMMILPTVAASALLYLAERRTRLGRAGYWARQWVAGLLFAGIAVLGTEFGVYLNGGTMNVRNAAPMCAGLIFGAPAGLIAGTIGGIERYFAVYWGAGAFTQLAGTISTIMSGALGALLRRFMFDDKKPGCVYGMAAGIVAEVFDMLLVFLVHMDDTRRGFALVEVGSAPMILMNGVAVMLSLLAVSLLSGERGKRSERKRTQGISQTFQKRLLLCVLLAFVITCVFTFAVQTKMSENESDSLLALNIEDVRSDIIEASDENLLKLARTAASTLDGVSSEIDERLLRRLAQTCGVAEIDIVDERGVVAQCTDPEFVGFDMHTGEQSREFLVLLEGQTEFVQDYGPIARDASISRKYAGVRLKQGGFVQLGYDAEQFQQDIDAQVVGAARNRHVGEGGFLIICDGAGEIVSAPADRDDSEALASAVGAAQRGRGRALHAGAGRRALLLHVPPGRGL